MAYKRWIHKIYSAQTKNTKVLFLGAQNVARWKNVDCMCGCRSRREWTARARRHRWAHDWLRNRAAESWHACDRADSAWARVRATCACGRSRGIGANKCAEKRLWWLHLDVVSPRTILVYMQNLNQFRNFDCSFTEAITFGRAELERKTSMVKINIFTYTVRYFQNAEGWSWSRPVTRTSYEYVLSSSNSNSRPG